MTTITMDNGSKIYVAEEQEYQVIWRDNHVVLTLKKEVDTNGNDII